MSSKLVVCARKATPNSQSRLPIKTNIATYKCYIRYRLTYAAPAWAGWFVKNDLIVRYLKVETLEKFFHLRNMFSYSSTASSDDENR
ncbi:hypothetical protein EVAR_54329_1 [Eumeta japonica]|uniref:Uncharacterized protein n=1 Tax=Eumeta variegata TaxID=151549 RepID=A0A4C1Y4J6_EUMVA|nr:hypothetical protein EVAR_54329_1 [Eumeta japonica]